MSDMTNAERGLVDTVIALTGIYTDEGIHVWLVSAHKLFGGRSAIDLIRSGEGTKVVAASWQLADGAFA